MKRRDITGMRCGNLTAIRYHHSKDDHTYWLCKCDCGKETVIRTQVITQQRQRTCGCLMKGHKGYSDDNFTKNDEIKEMRTKGMKAKDIAEALNMTVGALNSHISRLAYKGVYL